MRRGAIPSFFLPGSHGWPAKQSPIRETTLAPPSGSGRTGGPKSALSSQDLPKPEDCGHHLRGPDGKGQALPPSLNDRRPVRKALGEGGRILKYGLGGGKEMEIEVGNPLAEAQEVDLSDAWSRETRLDRAGR